MSSTAKYKFGKYQNYVSDRMRKNPSVAKIISLIFGYTAIGAYGRQLIFRRLLSYVPMEKVRNVLDLGCGQGEFSFMLADAHKQAKIQAIDIDEDAIKKIQETADHFNVSNLTTFRGKIQDLAKKNHYDLIFSVDVFEHIFEDVMPFRECYEALRPGGYLIIKMPARTQRIIAPDSWFDEFNKWKVVEHVGQVYELPDLIQRFRKENFKIITAFYSDGMLARAGWEFCYFMRKGGPILHLISLPIAKMLMRADSLFKNKKKGNYIQVVGQKPEVTQR